MADALWLPARNSISGKIFVDTNILIYAHGLDAGTKHDRASSILAGLWEEQTGIISVQVLQEFYVNVTRKIPHPISPAAARGIIRNYLAWRVETNDPATILLASEIEERNRLSFWNAMIVASASRAGAEKILTEDFSHGQVLKGMLIENLSPNPPLSSSKLNE
ncbi:MAG TPA: PIN domain-containing protein [Syntrophales bacterium]|nr:PIN domain-containing protein [Syntrophales bacterium]HPI56334.1 PIN domain-containing protein [Syntrophales bacterium]HPN24278.1 PIN domain-containing protein [Syntrophales bacterium]HQM28631.1 PIN domain-containing protein [Syntrophales bacterium]